MRKGERKTVDEKVRIQNADRRVLIFGGAGFIGSNWASRLLKETDASVHIFDNLSRAGVHHNLEWLKNMACKTGRLKVTIGDIRNAQLVERATADATEIYHFAAQAAVTTSVIDPRHDFEVNALGSFNVLEGARRSGNRPFVLFTSTNKVYGDMGARGLAMTSTRYRYTDCLGIDENQPLDFHSPYGCSKGSADQYVRDYSRIYGIPAVVFRMSCIAGEQQFGNEDQGWVAHFLYSALQEHRLTIFGDGRQVRDVLYVGDLMRAFDAARRALPRVEGEIYNIGGGAENTVSLLELMELIEELTGKEVDHIFEQRRPGDQLIYTTDFAKFSRDTGWKPRSDVRSTLAHIYDWWKSSRDIFEPELALAAAGIELPRTA